MKYKHAELMAQYAQDAMTTDKPWELWEYRPITQIVWRSCFSHVYFDLDKEYRRKPKTIKINGIDVPEPCRVAPENGTTYWLVALSNPVPVNKLCWWGNEGEVPCLEKGLIHLTKEAAEIHAKALLSFTNLGGTEDEQAL